MLQVAYRRFRGLWPSASIYVPTSAPDLLKRYCPGAIPLETRARNAVFQGGSVTSRLRPLLPQGVSVPLRELEFSCRQRFLGATQALLNWKRPEQSKAVGEYLDALRGSDLVAATGAGQITDAFAGGAGMALNTLQLAVTMGHPCCGARAGNWPHL